MKKISSLLFAFQFLLLFVFIKLLTLLLYLLRVKFWLPKKKNSIVFLENFPINNAGYNYRAKLWCDILKKDNYNCKIKTTIRNKEKFDYLISKNRNRYILLTSLIRAIQILSTIRTETVIVRRNIILYNEYGNLFMEKLISTIHQEMILDIDDDMMREDTSKSNLFFPRLLMENKNKFNDSFKFYRKYIVASDYLRNMVLERSSKTREREIVVMPTCVNYKKTEKKTYIIDDVISFGWIGSNGNQKYLDDIIHVLNEISIEENIELIVISGKEYINNEVLFPITNLEWSLDNEIHNLLKIDIGLMPLSNNQVTKGKGGFKLIQYMGLGIVSIAKAITINKQIIDNGTNGFLFYDDKELKELIINVLRKKENFKTIGRLAKEKVNNNYSFIANYNNLQKIIQHEE